jgi:signal transduction histidine kinase
VTDDSAACGRALKERERVIIEDVEADPEFAPHRHVAAAAGFRAVQSTPMFGQTGEPLGTLSTHFTRPRRPADEELRMTDLYARQAAAVIELRQSEAVSRGYQEELQNLTTRLIEAQELQSKHLARELHDVFSQRLAAIGMDIENIAQHTAESRDTLEDALDGVMQSVNELATDIHRMSRQLHPAILEDLGLSAAIKSECLAFSEQYRMPAEFLSVDVPHKVAEDVALCLYRVAQESLRNIGRHAGKARVHVTLRGSTDHVWLTVEDSGIGFDVEKVKRKRGLGLVSMEERVRIVGGSFSMTTVPGDGLRIEAKVPLRRPDRR